MKSTFTKLAAGVALLSLSAAAFAASSDCCCCLEACLCAVCGCL